MISKLVWINIFVLFVSVFTLCAVLGIHISIDRGGAYLIGMGLVFCALMLIYSTVRPDERISGFAELALIFLLVTSGAVILSYCCVRASSIFPFRDSFLAATDRNLSLDWKSYYTLLIHHPTILNILYFAYNGTFLETYIVLSALFILKKRKRLNQAIIGFLLGIQLTLFLGIFFPSLTAFYFYFPETIPHPEAGNWRFLSDTLMLRDINRPFYSSVGNLTALISFPSFHTFWAVFVMWASLEFLLLRIPVIIFNLLVIISTPVFGAHYFVDIIGGIIVSIFCLALITSLSARNSKQGSHFHFS